MLSDCRALDLTDDKGFLCGKILADLGVDVIKVEKPGGDPARKKAPFWRDIPDPEKSLYWFSYNSNKRGITLDIETVDGLQILKELVKTTDFLIESFPPGHMDTRGVGYNGLKEINGRVIYTSITPFGQDGPYREFQASDIIVMGMSGMLYLTGDADRPPLNMSLPQSYLLAGADGAVGSLVAYYHREKTGHGQLVDVSMQQSTAWFLANTIPYWEMSRTNLTRVGALRSMNARDSVQRQIWPCKDGYVFFFMLGGETGAKPFRRLVKWMDEEGMGDDYLEKLRWEELDMGTVTQEVLDRIAKPIGGFFLTRTRKEILDAAIKRNISFCSLSSMEDLVGDRNLKERGFWTDIDHPELGMKLPYPRQFATLSKQSSATRRRAPLIGEHNHEVYSEIGLSDRDLIALTQAGII
jgi:crotonobetainyl-CoA:carnitine CoA-transferase CaiB-like acyl-CoA transferase